MSKVLPFSKVRMSNKWKGQHAKTCRCGACLRKRLAEFHARVETMGGLRPPSDDHTIPVRPHWRKAPRYLKNDPDLHKVIFEYIDQLKRSKKTGG